MIVKMKFVNISGPLRDIDRITDLYLSKYEIQLESALSELKTVENLRPYIETNPYREAFARVDQYVETFQLRKTVDKASPVSLDLEEMFALVKRTGELFQEYQQKKTKLRTDIEKIRNKQLSIAPFRPLDYDLNRLFQFRFIKYTFGRIPLESYQKLEKYLLDGLGAIFVEGERDDSYVYGTYFVSPEVAQKVDAAFHSLHFEKIDLSYDYDGTPSEAYQHMKEQITSLTQESKDLDESVKETFVTLGPQLVATRDRLEELTNNFDVRSMAARIDDKTDDYYILCGWMAERDVEKFLHEIRNDASIFVVVEDDNSNYFGTPPTKLNNPKIFKPFEMFIKMYGLPAHNEMDPTLLVGLTYSFIFGAMFGDLGQGLVLLIGGFLLFRFKRIVLAGIIASAGFFSAIFGLLFGSVFGFEDIISPIWMRPINQMTQLPFVGKLNTVFIVAVGFGMVIILLTMIIHIVNAIRNHDKGGLWFDANGVAGLIFYGSAVTCIVLFLTGNPVPGGVILAIMFGLPLLIIFFKEPITHKLEKKTIHMKEGKGMFFVQGFFELFEVILSYFSNTLSFVRIGAFAVSHAAIMQVVLQLSGAEAGHINWIGIVLGNIIVIGFEGLIVGIQVLRLEYYELFSRFYRGNGRAFTPYSNKHATK